MSSVQVEVTVSDIPDWYIDKSEVGWLLVTPVGALNWNAAISLMIGSVILLISFGGQKFNWIRPKTFRLIGAGLVVIAVVFYAL